MEGDLELAPGFQVPPNGDYKSYHLYIDENLPPESPILYGLHPNAEIEFLTKISETLFRTVFEMQPRDSGAASSSGASRDEMVKCRTPSFIVCCNQSCYDCCMVDVQADNDNIYK